MPEKKTIQVRLSLEGNIAQKFLKIKRTYGLKTNADVVRLLITLEYERISTEEG